MKYSKKRKQFEASNVTYNPETRQALSYGWWQFVKVIEGKVVFNDYSYSVSTRKHQAKVRRLLETLGVKIDISLPIPEGLQVYTGLQDTINRAEEYLCDDFLKQKIKAQEQYQKTKHQRLSQNEAAVDQILGVA